MFTIKELAVKLLEEYKELESWEWVAKEHKISKPMAWRIAYKGYEPKNPYIRKRLGLVVYQPTAPCEKCGEVHKVPWCVLELGNPVIAPICSKCGQVHITKRCNQSSRNRRPPRVAIRLDNPESAAQSITRYMDTSKIDELIDLLELENSYY